MRNASSALSAASSACDHIRNWVMGTPKDEFVSMAVFSDGSYGAPKVKDLLLAIRNALPQVTVVHCMLSGKGLGLVIRATP